MHLNDHLPLLEEYLLCEEDSELRDQFANAFFLHQDDDVYKTIKSDIVKGLEINNAYRKSVLSRLTQEEKEEFANIAIGHGLDDIQKLDPKLYTENPYFKLLKGLREVKKGKIRFFTRGYKPYEAFLSDEQRVNNGHLSLPLGYFPLGLDYPAIEKGDTVWMSLIPHEINTMARPIEEAKGKVITLGLGLGYYAYMVSLKKDVTNVYAIENDPEIITFFKENLLPRFPNKDKIKIIEADAIAYAKEHGREFDYLFCDIYHNEEDGLPIYLKLLKFEESHFSYWIEDSILSYFRRYVLAFLEEQYDGYPEEAYKEGHDFSSKLFRSLYKATKNISIGNDDELLAFLEKESLKKLAKCLEM